MQEQNKWPKQKIIVLTTGGTIDKSYDELEGNLEISESLLKKYAFDKLRLPYTELMITTVMAKDSLTMTDRDRDLIAKLIEANMALEHPIVVIHGTDTVEHTLNYCKKAIPHPKVPVIFTGAMRPIGFIDSDGKQNVAEAFMAAKILPPGIYLSFHNEIFKAGEVTKLRDKGTFCRTQPRS